MEEIKSKDPAILYNADMHENAQAVFSKGDIDNPYLLTFGVTSVHMIEQLRGEIAIIDTGNDEVLYQRNKPLRYFTASGTPLKNKAMLNKMYVINNTVLVNTRAGTTVNVIPPVYKENDYIVGIGLTGDDPIDYDELPEAITLRVRIFYEDDEELKTKELLKEETVQVSKADPYKIYTWRDLQHMNDDLDGHYAIQNDIIFPEVGHYGYENFEPIGHPLEDDFDVTVGTGISYHRKGELPTTYPYWTIQDFAGILEGNNHKIEGLYIHYPTKNLVGLFRSVEAGLREVNFMSIRNITIYHVGITGKSIVGGLTGRTGFGISVYNVHVYALNDAQVKSTAHESYVGGLIGIAQGGLYNNNMYSVQGSSVHTDVEGTHYVGGLIGSIGWISVYNSYTTGNVTGKNTVGGLLGYARDYTVRFISDKYIDGYVSGYATGHVTGQHSVGGLVGHAETGVFFGYATGDVRGKNNVGGVIGNAQWDKTQVFHEQRDLIVRAYSAGDVTGSTRVGGVVGYVSPASSFSRSDEKDRGTNIIVGYSRGRISSDDTSAGFLLGAVSSEQKHDVNGYVSTTSDFVGITENQAQGIGGTRIDISEVTDENYQERFSALTFGDNFGEWTWVGNGTWPVINITLENLLHSKVR